MKVHVYGPLRTATGEKTVDLRTDGETVGDLLDRFLDEYPGTASQLVDDDGDLRPSVRVMVGDEKAARDQPVSEHDEIKLFPAMRGG
ncbi:ubiquitin-like small modifier protein 1 [Haloarchaeobius baliensis]|uniref:ubiquitin-like small modifier protein 1 n=1 Tax=Haloarchaeobius baliensis TaxID=1670458 RepID=UPI003F884CE2